MERSWVEAVAYIAGIVVLACCSYFLQLAAKSPKESGLIVDRDIALPPSSILPRSWFTGSGIPEVKLILKGWVISGFLNFRVLVVNQQHLSSVMHQGSELEREDRTSTLQPALVLLCASWAKHSV